MEYAFTFTFALQEFPDMYFDFLTMYSALVVVYTAYSYCAL